MAANRLCSPVAGRGYRRAFVCCPVRLPGYEESVCHMQLEKVESKGLHCLPWCHWNGKQQVPKPKITASVISLSTSHSVVQYPSAPRITESVEYLADPVLILASISAGTQAQDRRYTYTTSRLVNTLTHQNTKLNPYRSSAHNDRGIHLLS